MRRPAGSSQQTRAMEQCSGQGRVAERRPRSQWGEHERKQELRRCQVPQPEPKRGAATVGGGKAGSQ